MKKRVISLLLALVLALGLLPTAAFAADEPTAINSATDFKNMKPNGKYILKQDITVKEPYASDFFGTFDGAGHTITLEITASSPNTGLFSKVGEDGTVKNVITAGSVKGTNQVGGIAGVCEGTIEYCGNTAKVTGKKNVGGITGQAGYYSANSADSKKAYLTNCYNTGTISLKTGSRNMYSGGILGSSQNSSLNTCVNTGSVSGKMSGGIYGFAATSDSRTAFLNCYYLVGTNAAAQTDCTPYTDAKKKLLIN